MSMNEPQDALSQARAEAAAWTERIQELEAASLQSVQGEAAADPYHQPSERIAGLPPRELAQSIRDRSISTGMRDEDISAKVFAAYAQRAHAGDPRFVIQSDGSFYREEEH